MAEIESNPKEVSKTSIVIKSVVALALGILILMLPRPDNLTPEGHRFLALLLTVVVLWVSEAVPIGVTALLAGASLILLKIQPAQSAWAPYASPAVMFVLMVIMFGVVLNEVGLANRMMFYLLKFAGTKVKRLSLILAIGCTLTSTIFHDATITVIMVFAFVPVFMSMGMKPGMGHRLPTFFFMLIPLSASAGGFGTLLGGGRNPLALEILQKFSGGQIKIGFLEYIVIMFPICILTAVATWAILWVLLRPKEKELVGIELADPGPMSGKEWGVLTVFVITFILWFSGDLTGWHYSVPAAFAILGFCAPGWISFRTICDKFPWESWIVFGAGVSMGGIDAGQRRRALSGRDPAAAFGRQTDVCSLLRHRLFRVVPVQHDEQLGGRGPDAAHCSAHGRNDADVAAVRGHDSAHDDLLHHARDRLPPHHHRLQHRLLQPEGFRQDRGPLVPDPAGDLCVEHDGLLAADRVRQIATQRVNRPPPQRADSARRRWGSPRRETFFSPHGLLAAGPQPEDRGERHVQNTQLHHAGR